MFQRSEHTIVVEGGSMGRAVIADPAIATIGPASASFVRGSTVSLAQDRENITIYSGAALGRTTLTVSADGPPASLDVVVLDQSFGPPLHMFPVSIMAILRPDDGRTY